MTRGKRQQGGFTLVELLVVIAIVGMLGAIAAPQLLGAREKAKHTACWDAMHVLDGELVNRVEGLAAIGDPTPAQSAIDEVLERLEGSDNATNPRNFAMDAYLAAPSTLFVPPPETACTVFLIDGTDDHPLHAPTIVITAYERGVNSFRIAFD